MRQFEIKFYAFDHDLADTAVIELSDEVINRVDDKWRSALYNLYTPEEIAKHFAHNLFINKIGISQMDGWADLDDSHVKIIKRPDLDVEFDIEAKEVK